MGKRTTSSSIEDSVGAPLKKRVSSLFSISTIAEGGDQDEANREDFRLLLHPSHAKETAIATVPSEGFQGLYVDDDDDDDISESEHENQKNVAFLPKTSSQSSSATTDRVQRHPDATADTCHTPSLESTLTLDVDSKHLTLNDQYRTGIVVEEGARHFDRRLHKERPARIHAIVSALKTNGIWDDCQLIDDDSAYDDDDNNDGHDDTTAGRHENARQFLNDNDYLRVHLPGYITRLDRLDGCACCDRLHWEAQQYQSVYFTKDSVQQAKRAAATLCVLVECTLPSFPTTDNNGCETAVRKRDLRRRRRLRLMNGFAIIRPPGHHAEPGVAGGYCILNNVAIAAAYAIAKLGCRRVLIVDWDVHHGNGTQAIFLDDPNVLYFSVHRYNGATFYPFSKAAKATQVGSSKAKGYTINVGWSHKGMGDAEYLSVWRQVLLPVAMDFNPDLVLISAGFDAAKGDMGECNVTPNGFATLTRQLKRTMSRTRPRQPAPIVCALEGGYVRSVLGACVCAVVSALKESNCNSMDNSDVHHENESIDPTADLDIQQTISAQRPYWKCFRDVS